MEEKKLYAHVLFLRLKIRLNSPIWWSA